MMPACLFIFFSLEYKLKIMFFPRAFEPRISILAGNTLHLAKI